MKRVLTALAALAMLTLAADSLGLWRPLWHAITGLPTEILPAHMPVWLWLVALGFILCVVLIRNLPGRNVR